MNISDRLNNIEEADLKFITEISEMTIHKKILLNEIIIGLSIIEQKEIPEISFKAIKF